MGLLDRFSFTPYATPFTAVDPRTGQPMQQSPMPMRPAPAGAPPVGQMVMPNRPDGRGPMMQQPMGGLQPGQKMGPLPAPQPIQMQPPVAGGMPFDDSANFDANRTPVPIQPQPGDAATGINQEPQGFMGKLNASFTDRKDGWNNSDWMQLGLSLLGNAQNGGDWSGVAQDFGAIQQGITGRQDREREIGRQTTQDERAAAEFEMNKKRMDLDTQATEKAMAEEAAQMDRWKAAMEIADPEDRSVLEAIGPKGYAQYQLQQQDMEARREEAKLERQSRAQESAADRAARIEEARIRSANENSIGRYFQAADAEALSSANSAAAQIQSRGLPMLQQVRKDIEGARELAGKSLPANARITLGRIFGGPTGDRAALEAWRARVLGPALETLRGMGAMSEREMEAAVQSFSNPDMTYEAAIDLMDERIRLAENKLLETRAMNDFFTESGGVTGKRNKAGQDWGSFLQAQLEGDQKRRADTTPKEEKSYPAPNKNALALLRSQRSDPQVIAEFNEKFGPGAAEQYLQGLPAPPAAARTQYGKW